MNRRKWITYISLSAIFIALNIVLTIYLIIPLPGQGYANLSDAIIILLSSLIHPLLGAVVGAISGAISDLILGYGIYIPFTFLIKGIEGLVVGYILRIIFKSKPKIGLFLVFPVAFFGGILMMSGYFFMELAFFDLSVASADILGNFLQGIVGSICGTILFYSLFKLPIIKYLDNSANACLLEKMGS